MGSEGKWQSECSGETGTEVTRSEELYRNVRAFPRARMHALRRFWFAEIAAQLVHKFREIVACSMKRTAERPSGCGVTPACAAEAQVDAARKERFERAELFCNDQRRMIRQHDAARAHADFRSCICDVGDQYGSRRARHAVNIMVFSQP